MCIRDRLDIHKYSGAYTEVKENVDTYRSNSDIMKKYLEYHPPDHYAPVSCLLGMSASQSSALMPLHSLRSVTNRPEGDVYKRQAYICLPNKVCYTLAVFVKDFKGNEPQASQFVAHISAVVYSLLINTALN